MFRAGMLEDLLTLFHYFLDSAFSSFLVQAQDVAAQVTSIRLAI